MPSLTRSVRRAAGVSIILLYSCGYGPQSSQQGAATGPGESDDEGAPLVWNAWFEEHLAPTPRYDPVDSLVPGGSYLLTIDLAALAYSRAYSREAGLDLQEWLAQRTASRVELDVLLLHDPAFLQPAGRPGRVSTMIVDLEKVRADLDGVEPFYQEPSTFRPFVYGQVTFRVRAGEQQGWTSVGLSVWADQRLPVDEFTVPICIGYCSGPSPPVRTTSLRGVDPIRAATSSAGQFLPDLSLHFAEVWPDRTIGIMSCAACGDGDSFITWDLERSPEELSDYIGGTILRAMERAAASDNRDDLESLGRDLFNVLFPLATEESLRARGFFQSFVTDGRVVTDPPLSIFVRYVTYYRNRPLFVPFSLLTVPREEQEGSVLLGLDFRVEVPLQRQDYSSGDVCLSNWKALIPPGNVKDPAMEDARTSMVPFLEDLSEMNDPDAIVNDVRSFRTWLESPTPQSPDILVILAHHEDNQFFFNARAKRPAVTSATGVRTFPTPALAIINACGAARPSAHDWILQLNRRGMSAVLATSMNVNASLAGRFMTELTGVLKENRDVPGLTLGEAVWHARRRLADWEDEPGKPYGAMALVYQLFGNSGLQVCAPGS